MTHHEGVGAATGGDGGAAERSGGNTTAGHTASLAGGGGGGGTDADGGGGHHGSHLFCCKEDVFEVEALQKDSRGSFVRSEGRRGCACTNGGRRASSVHHASHDRIVGFSCCPEAKLELNILVFFQLSEFWGVCDGK